MNTAVGELSSHWTRFLWGRVLRANDSDGLFRYPNRSGYQYFLAHQH